MEEQADVVESFTPEQIGHAFVTQFYAILHQNPESVHRFYQDNSSMTRPALDGSVTTVTTMKGISDFMLSLDYKDCTSDIMSTDAQSSYGDGVLVLVTGCLSGEDNTRRKFTETFFLAPQSNGYYVLNNAFRFVDEDPLPTDSCVEVEESGEIAATCTLADEAELAEVFDESLSIYADAIEPVPNGDTDVHDQPGDQITVEEEPEHADAIEPVPNGDPDVHDKSGDQITVEEEPEPAITKPPVESVNHVVGQVAVGSSSDVPGIAKKSYASILKNREKGMLTTPMHVPSSTDTKNSATTSGHQARGTMPSLSKPQGNGPAISAANSTDVHGSSETGILKAEGKGFSVYLGHLPYDATADQLEQELKKFGPIKEGGIQVVQHQNYCFGFVEFESLRSAQKAIQASPISIGWHRVFVEEKRSTAQGKSGAITPSPGRGGYHGSGFQGKENFLGGRGHGARSGDGYNRRYQNVGPGGGQALRQGGPKQ